MKPAISKMIQNYYDEKLRLHGATAQGVDWKNLETQEIRFALLCQLFDGVKNFEVNDLGCGYGAFAQYLEKTETPFEKYYGYDISEEMIRQAETQFPGSTRCLFIASGTPDKRQFTVSSGIFNVKLDTPEAAWKEVVSELLETMCKSSRDGFSFNMLKPPTDEIYRREHLFYADPAFYEQYCLEHFGKKVTVLMHEKLFEFTILVSQLH
jgi:SAM-dependent methyltransferase